MEARVPRCDSTRPSSARELAKLQRGHLPTVYPTRSKSEVARVELAAVACPVAMETDGKGPVPDTMAKLPGTYVRPRWRASGWT